MKPFHPRFGRVRSRLVFLVVPLGLGFGATALLFHAAAVTTAATATAAVPAAQIFIRPESDLQIRYVSPDTRHTQAVAWGDVDGDGDLDLAVGNGAWQTALPWLDIGDYNPIDQVYLNDGRGQFTLRDIGGEPPGGTDTRGIAWGDMDGDGDLDLATANGGAWSGPQPNIVYENVNGVLSHSAEADGAGWASAESRMSSSTGWGDWDSDGDLDLAFGNEDAPNQVYENISGTLRFDPAGGVGWEAPQALPTSSLAWGDVDGDGDLDLAFGNYGGGDALQLYENISDTLQLAPDRDIGWASGSSDLVQAIAWGDWDNDGDLDLAVGGGSRGNERGSFLQIWENEDGKLALDAATGLGWSQRSPDGLAALAKPAGLAWVDWDRDGDLDLALANNAGGGWGRANQIYENDGGIMVLEPNNGFGWQSPLRAGLNSETTYAVAAGDADGDGDLDLAFGNGGIEGGGQANLLFTNELPVVGFDNKPWESAAARPATGAAWGDWDGDGDLDLALAADQEPVVVYENDEGVLGWDPAAGIGWEAPITHTAASAAVAWGDWDGDSDLDLAVANDGAPDRVYENRNGTLALDPALGLGWQTPISDTSRTSAVAWGDFDSDGDLDLVLARINDFAQVYENEGGTLRFDPANGLGWVSPAALTAEDAAWGDWDDDGDLDLALGSRVYENEGDTLLLDPTHGLGWDTAVPATSVAWGDMDGDGDPDLAVGSRTRARVYRNDGGSFAFDPRNGVGWESFDIMPVRGLAWGDADGDGDFDLATAGDASWGFEPNRIYENTDGMLSAVAVWESADTRLKDGILQQSQDVAWGDVDGDGDLDLAFANYCTGNDCDTPERRTQVYLNTLQRTAVNLPARAVPLLSVSDPDTTAQANFYASPEILSSNVIEIPYKLVDASETPVGRIEMFYSLDGGDNWQPARPSAETATTNLATSAAGTRHSFGWDTFGSDFFGRSDNAAIRLVVYPTPPAHDTSIAGSYLYFNSVAGSFQRPSTTATTFPFRVQSTQIRVVDDEGAPVSGAWVYRLPTGSVDGAALMPDPTRPQTTDDEGLLPGGGALQPGDRLVALLPIPGNPVTFTRKARLFHTSAPAAADGLDMAVFDQPGIVELVVSDEHPLLLFDLDVSLEWDARNDATFLTELSNSFSRASEILYDVTNGQAALGVVRVSQGKENWPQADVVVLSNNSMRPSAAIGGIAGIPISETVRVDLGATKVISNAYHGGQIRMGTVWDPFGENTAELGEEWWRALAHELAHYLLFLPDNYLGIKDGGVLGRINCQGSFMTSTYDPAYSEFLTEAQWLGACRDSLAQRTTGRTDWETIGRFYPMLAPPPTTTTPFEGPAAQPLGLTDILFRPPQEPRTPLRARNFDVRDADNERLRLPAAQAYLFQTQGTADPTDDMILLLGTPTGGGDRLKVRGAFPGDRLCLIESSAGQAFVGCDDDLQAADVSIRADAMDPDWQPQIDVGAVTSRTLQITVTQSLSPDVPIHVQVFPLHYWSVPNFAGLSPTATLQTTDAGHVGTLTMTLPAYEVAVHVWAGGDEQREAVSHFTLNPPWPVGGPNTGGIGGPNATGIGGPNATGIGGPNATGIGGPNATGIGGPNATGIGGPNATGIGGPNATGIGGASQSFNAPILSADAQVVVYSKLGFFEDNGVETLQVRGSVPAAAAHPWLVPVGQSYAVELDDTVTTPRVIGFNYLQRDVPEGYENTLTVYFLPKGGTRWQRLETMQYVENLVVADLQAQSGTYAVMSTVAMSALTPGWNLFVYPLSDSRPVTDTLSSIAGRYGTVYESARAGERPPLSAKTNVTRFEFAHTYWIWLEGDDPVTPYLAPPGRSPDGQPAGD